MDLSKRLALLKFSAKEEYPVYTPEDVIFLFEEITHPEGVILNQSHPYECYVLFPSSAPMEEIYNLNKDSSWVGAPMLLTIRQPPSKCIEYCNQALGK